MPGSNHVGAIGSDVWLGIAKLGEECGESVQVIGKIFAFPDLSRAETHPDGQQLHASLRGVAGILVEPIDVL